MLPRSPAEREALIGAFVGAQVKQDLDAFYQVATPDFLWRLPIGPTPPIAREIGDRPALAAYLRERAERYEGMRVDEVVYYHAPDASFISFRITAKRRGTGEPIDVQGLERYLFRDGLVMQKDSYWKRIGAE